MRSLLLISAIDMEQRAKENFIYYSHYENSMELGYSESRQMGQLAPSFYTLYGFRVTPRHGAELILSNSLFLLLYSPN